MNTSGSSCHTLAVDVIKWAWVDILYLMHVLYVAVGAPSLVYYLNGQSVLDIVAIARIVKLQLCFSLATAGHTCQSRICSADIIHSYNS